MRLDAEVGGAAERHIWILFGDGMAYYLNGTWGLLVSQIR